MINIQYPTIGIAMVSGTGAHPDGLAQWHYNELQQEKM